jgi:predicted GNAT family N-acyltransferase
MGGIDSEILLGAPSTEAEWLANFAVRYAVLRAPLGMPLGSENDSLDEQGSASQHMALFVDGELVATGRLDVLGHGIGQVRYMAVVASHRGQGFGHQVLAQLETAAKAGGMSQMVLNARENAIGFYEQAGYECIASLGNVISGIPHFRMEKRLV